MKNITLEPVVTCSLTSNLQVIVDFIFFESKTKKIQVNLYSQLIVTVLLLPLGKSMKQPQVRKKNIDCGNNLHNI